jgi:hypothetical protein
MKNIAKYLYNYKDQLTEEEIRVAITEATKWVDEWKAANQIKRASIIMEVENVRMPLMRRKHGNNRYMEQILMEIFDNGIGRQR